MTPFAGPAAGSAGVRSTSEPSLSRFHIVSLAFLRAKQLKAGARPRVDASGHKPTRVALLEVMADTISWTIA
jgi:DNA-directed RNA polymerase subunit K/omega